MIVYSSREAVQPGLPSPRAGVTEGNRMLITVWGRFAARTTGEPLELPLLPIPFWGVSRFSIRVGIAPVLQLCRGETSGLECPKLSRSRGTEKTLQIVSVAVREESRAD